MPHISADFSLDYLTPKPDVGTFCSIPHKCVQCCMLSDPFSLVIIVVYQCEPSVNAVIWKTFQILPSLSVSTSPWLILVSHTCVNADRILQNRHSKHNRGTCMLANTHRLAHQGKERLIHYRYGLCAFIMHNSNIQMQFPTSIRWPVKHLGVWVRLK